ncbi:MAG: hypothetical protein IJD48_03390 [Clostridia bacterium]|nr:hypothetical protein [Clostridia bacterium]
MGIMINWSALIVAFCVGLVGLWTAYSFLNKRGLYLFSILAVGVCSAMITKASVFSLPIEYNVVLMPLVYFSLLTCYHKHGKEEAKRLFFITVISMAVMFVFKFFEAAYIDSAAKTQTFLDWQYLSLYISNIIAFLAASGLTMFITSKINVSSLNNRLKLAVYMAIVSAIDVLIYTLLISIGVVSLINIILVLIIKLVITAAVCLLLGYFEKYLNRKVDIKKQESSTKVETKTEEKQEEPKQEPTKEEILTENKEPSQQTQIATEEKTDKK